MFTAIRVFLFGLVIGLLVTPRTGRENRRRLAEGFQQFRSRATETLGRRIDEIQPQVQARTQEWMARARTLIDRAQRQAGEQFSQVRSDLPGRVREIRETVPGRAVVIGGVIREEASRIGRRAMGGVTRREGGNAHPTTELDTETTGETTDEGQTRRGRIRQPRETET